SWERKGYIFDGCIHFLVGTGESSDYYTLWKELIDIQGMEIVNFEEYSQIIKDGTIFTLYANPDKLKEELIRIAPEDNVIIEEFVNAIKEYQKIKFSVDKAPETLGIIGLFRLLKTMKPYLKLNKKWNITIDDFLSQLNNQFLKDVLPESFEGGDRSLLMILTPLSTMSTNSAGYPIGGSLKFAQKIEERYLSLGGKIFFNQKVKKIIVDNNIATGIILENGEEHFSDIIISAADGHYTIFEMLGGKYINKKIAECYKSRELFSTMVRVSLGVNRTFKDSPHMYSLFIDEPIFFENNKRIDRLEITIYNFDPTLAPEGKTAIIVAIITHNDDYWLNLRVEDRKKYDAEKNRIAEEVIDRLDKYFGDFKSKVEVIDVATPATYFRYTNNWKGRFMGWAITPKGFKSRLKKTLPGLDNFYLISQWTAFGGGVTTGLDSGRNVTQIICKKDKRKFISS
ncbi:MAG: phytoene desaturase family protein, partial [Candidatus Thorarchaeota archaeon]